MRVDIVSTVSEIKVYIYIQVYIYIYNAVWIKLVKL